MQFLTDGRPNIEKHVKYILVMYADDMKLSQKRQSYKNRWILW